MANEHQGSFFETSPVSQDIYGSAEGNAKHQDKPLHFDGETFDYEQDADRLTTSLERVAHLMRDGKKRTLQQIAGSTGSSESGVSARLRDLRKDRFSKRFAVQDVHSERCSGGKWLYWITFNQPNKEVSNASSDTNTR